MKCEICDRKAEKSLCRLHEEAHRNLLRSFESWRKAMNIYWEKYLEEVQKNPFTGGWTKEVVAYLLASGSSKTKIS